MAFLRDILLDEVWPGLFLIWLIHLVPAGIGCGVVWWIARKRVQWLPWDFLVLVLPYYTWALAFVISAEGKDWGNLYEGMGLGVIVPLAPVIRSLLGPRRGQRTVAILNLVALMLVAVAIWALVPEIRGE